MNPRPSRVGRDEGFQYVELFASHPVPSLRMVNGVYILKQLRLGPSPYTYRCTLSFSVNGLYGLTRSQPRPLFHNSNPHPRPRQPERRNSESLGRYISSDQHVPCQRYAVNPHNVTAMRGAGSIKVKKKGVPVPSGISVSDRTRLIYYTLGSAVMLSPFRPDVLGLWSNTKKGSRLVFSNHVLTGEKNLEFGSFEVIRQIGSSKKIIALGGCGIPVAKKRKRKKRNALLKIERRKKIVLTSAHEEGSVRLETKPSW